MFWASVEIRSMPRKTFRDGIAPNEIQSHPISPLHSSPPPQRSSHLFIQPPFMWAHQTADVTYKVLIVPGGRTARWTDCVTRYGRRR